MSLLVSHSLVVRLFERRLRGWCMCECVLLCACACVCVLRAIRAVPDQPTWGERPFETVSFAFYTDVNKSVLMRQVLALTMQDVCLCVMSVCRFSLWRAACYPPCKVFPPLSPDATAPCIVPACLDGHGMCKKLLTIIWCCVVYISCARSQPRLFHLARHSQTVPPLAHT